VLKASTIAAEAAKTSTAAKSKVPEMYHGGWKSSNTQISPTHT
jgi:hypothetical protein